jgi:CTP:molybdopterin cytidylyltransferase MocA
VTVAAVVLAASARSALTDAAGRPSVRRIVESAWAGGAVPIVVVAPEQDGAVAAALAGSPAVLAAPAPQAGGPVGQIVRGIDVAAGQVSDTDAALVWPARLVWVDAETVTSLIEAHGVDRASALRPSHGGEPGWPVLLPLEQRPTLAGLATDRMPDELLDDLRAAGVPFRDLDLGDPGVVYDRDTPIDRLPRYEGPLGPAGGPPPDWGAPAADRADEAPLEGPALAPYAPAAGETE